MTNANTNTQLEENTTMLTSAYSLLNLLLLGWVPMVEAAGHMDCDDPVPIDVRVITEGTRFRPFTGASGKYSVCYLGWEGEPMPPLVIFGPTWVAESGHTFSSPRQAAAQYAEESSKGVERLPGARGAYMVFDPATQTRRVFVEYGGMVYMIVSNDRVPLAVLAEGILGGSALVSESPSAPPSGAAVLLLELPA